MKTMRATVFHGANDIRVEEVSRPHAGVGEAAIRVPLTTICGTDLHILRGDYPVKPGLIIGHEPVGVTEQLGPGITGYKIGDRVLVGAVTPCGQCRACLAGHLSQCGHSDGYEALGGWRIGNTINGAQAEYLLVPSAQANLAKNNPSSRPGSQLISLIEWGEHPITPKPQGPLHIFLGHPVGGRHDRDCARDNLHRALPVLPSRGVELETRPTSIGPRKLTTMGAHRFTYD